MILKIYKSIMRIKEYINVSKFIEDWKKENPDNDVFGISNRPRKGIRKMLMENEEEIIKKDNEKRLKNLEKRKHIRRLRNRRDNK